MLILKKVLIVLSLLGVIASECYAQTSEAISDPVSIHIAKEIKPPILLITEGSIKFIDDNNNGVINANEKAEVRFKVKNAGRGDATGLKLGVNATGDVVGLLFKKETSLTQTISVGEDKELVFPLSSNLQTADGEVIFEIKLIEPQGFSADPFTVKVKTKKFIPPSVELVDHAILGSSGTSLQKKRPFELQLLFQNTGYGKAENVQYALSIDSKILVLAGELNGFIGDMDPGQQKDIKVELIIPDNYTEEIVNVVVKSTEKLGKFGANKTIQLRINSAFSSAQLVVQNAIDPKLPEINVASLKSDVDKDIPSSGIANPNRFALVIGNEDYSSKQPGLSVETNVAYARNDANIFAEYARQTLGVPSNQIKLIIDATAGQMRQGISWLVNNIKAFKGNAEVFVYYSGHGLPSDDKQPYLVPVDVSGLAIEESGIALQTLYDSLGRYPTKKSIVFLDACFSGGARNKPLLAMKAVKVIPKNQQLTGQVVVMSSSSGSETSGVYNSKLHGYFTYFLLKNLKESKGQIALKKLSEQINDQVVKVSSNESKPQNPQILVSPEIANLWQSWNLLP